MIRWDKQQKVTYSAKIVKGEKSKSMFSKKEIEAFIQGIEQIEDERKRAEGFAVKICLETGKKIILTKKEIQLYFTSEAVSRKEKCIITENKELYSLIENLIQS